MSECCPVHGPEFRSFSEQYGAGCKKKLEPGSPYANKNNYCRWRPGATGFDRAGNGGAQPQRAGAPRSNYVPDPAKDRSIVAQVAMKAAARLYAGMMVQRDGPKDRVDMLAEMISAAHRINDNIQRMSEPRTVPAKPALGDGYKPGITSGEYDEPPFPDDEDAQRWQS